MDGLIVNKILSGVDTCFKVLGRYSKNLQEGKATHQWLLDKYLKLEEESLNNVLEELKMDSQEFFSLLYDLQLRLRALRDILNPFNMKIDEITEELKDKGIIPNRISEIEDEDGLCFYFKKENYNVYLEVYRDLDMGYIVDDNINKKVIANVDIQNISEFIKYMNSSN